MKYLIIFCLSTQFAFAGLWGKKPALTEAQNLKTAIANMEKTKDKEILVKAKVGKVCEKKGCWMSLENAKKDIRVTFKDYDFFVPLSLVGKEVLVQGKLLEHTMSEGEARHYARDAGLDPDKVKTPLKEYRMVATGVQLTK